MGFIGNALLDLEVAKVIAEVDASVFVLDFVPNASVEQMKERMETFYRIIRSKHPDTPIIFIEDPIFPHTFYDEKVAKEETDVFRTVAPVRVNIVCSEHEACEGTD